MTVPLARAEAMAAVGLGCIEQTITYAQFTDNTDATGYKDLADPLPPGALVIGWRVRVATGFTGGGTSAIVELGVSGNLAVFSADTGQSVYTSGTIRGSASIVASSADYMNAGQTVRVTVSDSADFTNISAGVMTVTVWYLI